MEGPLPYLYTKRSIHSEAESCIRRRDALASDVTTNCAVDSCLLTSRREPRPRPRGRPYARAPEGEVAHAVVVVTVPGYGQRLLMGCVIVLARDDVEIPCYTHRDESPCLVDAEVFPRCWPSRPSTYATVGWSGCLRYSWHSLWSRSSSGEAENSLEG
jgi:hypothetical protein